MDVCLYILLMRDDGGVPLVNYLVSSASMHGREIEAASARQNAACVRLDLETEFSSDEGRPIFGIVNARCCPPAPFDLGAEIHVVCRLV